MDKTLRIKLYGESLKIHKIELNIAKLKNFNKVANELNEPLNMAILNLDFFSLLNMSEVNSMTDIIDKTFNGLVNNKKSQIEISHGRRKIGKFNVDELFRETRLFPLFNTQTTIFNTDNLSEGIYIVEKEIGLVGQYELRLNNFQVDLLKFFLTKIEVQEIEYEILNNISYDNKFLTSFKSDTLLTSQSCFVITK